MTPQELVASLAQMTPQQLGNTNFSTLMQARELVPRRTPEQDQLAGYEHRAMNREIIQENPWMALPLLPATVAYQPYKMAMGKSRSNASLGQMGQGLLGVGEGLWGAFQQAIRQGTPDRTQVAAAKPAQPRGWM